MCESPLPACALGADAVMAMYILLSYLYRDAHNYKQHGSVVLANTHGLPLVAIDNAIRAQLIEREGFDHTQWNVPGLHFENSCAETDHPWHEYMCVEMTTVPGATIHSTVEEFLLRIAHAKT
jgi:hypothetical protein